MISHQAIRKPVALASILSLLILGISACSDDAPNPSTTVETPSVKDEVQAVAPVVSCESLLAFDLTEIGGAGSKITAAEKTIYKGAEACVVEGSMTPTVGFKVILPTKTWTQRYLQLGCGGLCGMINLTVGAADGCPLVNNSEFVLASTDMGHRGMGGDFGDDPQKRIDFAYRGVHITAQASKALISQFYGQAPRYSYFSGCSDGGREAVVEAQRFPEDFDGILAGAPAMNFSVQNSFYHGWQAASNTNAKGEAILHAQDMPVLNAGAIAACDHLDGLTDGLISAPLSCKFDPADTLCTDGQTTGCLTQEKVDAARKLYAGPKDPETGLALTLGGPQPGSELSWIGVFIPRPGSEMIFSTMIAEGALKHLVYEQNPAADYTLKDFEFTEASFAQIKALNGLYSGTNPDLAAFNKSGGKLILWHGWSDPHISPYNTIQYYESVKALMGPDTDEFLQLYLFPGMYHCDGGSGPHDFDLLTAMMNWVEHGEKPTHIVASHDGTAGAPSEEGKKPGGPGGKDGKPGKGDKDGPMAGSPDGQKAAVIDIEYVRRSRPVFPYPMVAKYTGNGDVNNATNFIATMGDTLGNYHWAGQTFFLPNQQVNCEIRDNLLNCQ